MLICILPIAYISIWLYNDGGKGGTEYEFFSR
ncbi:hypothetical protein M2444_005536 [Paenibacillus sp. PastF-3]|nr:hypothetical protein [Paenibacillus sp. PastF-3]